MTPEQFTYWLQGYTEIAQATPSAEQWQIIKDHLDTVFFKITPPRVLSREGAEKLMEELQKPTSRIVGTLHDGREVVSNEFNGFLSLEGTALPIGEQLIC